MSHEQPTLPSAEILDVIDAAFKNLTLVLGIAVESTNGTTSQNLRIRSTSPRTRLSTTQQSAAQHTCTRTCDTTRQGRPRRRGANNSLDHGTRGMERVAARNSHGGSQRVHPHQSHQCSTLSACIWSSHSSTTRCAHKEDMLAL